MAISTSAATLRALAAALFVTSAAYPCMVSAEQFRGIVTRVSDGDTFRIEGMEPAIRVWGLDAPERDERGGSRADVTLRALIQNQTVQCTFIDVDRYQRIVAQCFLPDGRDIAAMMIDAGVAAEYCRYSRGYYGHC